MLPICSLQPRRGKYMFTCLLFWQDNQNLVFSLCFEVRHILVGFMFAEHFSAGWKIHHSYKSKWSVSAFDVSDVVRLFSYACFPSNFLMVSASKIKLSMNKIPMLSRLIAEISLSTTWCMKCCTWHAPNRLPVICTWLHPGSVSMLVGENLQHS